MASPIPPGAFHVSRQAFAQSLDFAEVARNDTLIDRVLGQATANVESFLHRGFFPWTGSRSFDWPDEDMRTSYRLWLDDNELVSLTSATSGGVTLNVSELPLYPTTGPPYDVIETNRSGSSFFQAGDTNQKSLVLNGVWGYKVDALAVTTLASTINTTTTTVPLTSSAGLGVGNVILVDSEYMVITAVGSTSSGQTLQTPLTASAAGTSVAVTTGSSFLTGEVITLDSEQMLVVDVTGNTLVVKRAWNGTVLATHSGSTIYVKRTLTVRRNVCVSTVVPASHNSGATVSLHVIPDPVQALTTAEASWLYGSHSQGWQAASTVSGRNVPGIVSLTILQDARAYAKRTVGRKGRQRAV